MLTPSQILLGLLLPAAVAALLAIIICLTKGNSWGATLGLATALALAYKPMSGSWPHFPPISKSDWPLYFIFPLAIIALFQKKIPWTLRPLIALIFAATSAWLALRPVSPSLLATASVALIAVLVWALTEPIVTRRPGFTGPILLWLLSTGSALLLLLGASPRLGFFATTFAAVFGAYFVVSLIFKKTTIAHGPVLVTIIPLATWVAYGYFDSAVITPTELTLLAAAPALAWIAEITPIDKWKPWKRELLRTALVAAPIIVAIILAAIQFKKDAAGMDM